MSNTQLLQIRDWVDEVLVDQDNSMSGEVLDELVAIHSFTQGLIDNGAYYTKDELRFLLVRLAIVGLQFGEAGIQILRLFFGDGSDPGCLAD